VSKLELIDKFVTRAFYANLVIGFLVMLSDLAISFFELEIQPLVHSYDSIFTIVMVACIGTMICLRIIEMF
jgi:hypothetical protein